MKKSVLNLKNKTVGDIDLDASIFGVKKLPDLIPGKQLDKPVSLLYTVPVKIVLD